MLTSSVTDTAATTATSTNKKNDLGNKDVFLKLLVTQMQYQDPLKPQDATQMSSQLAQYSMVEQQTTTNKLLSEIASAGGTSGPSASPLGSSASYLGHSVTVNQNEIYYNGQPQQFTAVLNGDATQAQAFIFDANGNPVRTINMSQLNNGSNPMVWDGLTDSGASAPQGNYTIQVSATNINGGTVDSSIQRSGIVNAVRFTPSGTEMMVGGIAAPLNKITEIRL